MENIEIISFLDTDFPILGTENIVTKKGSFIWLLVIIGLLFLVAGYFILREMNKKQEADI